MNRLFLCICVWNVELIEIFRCSVGLDSSIYLWRAESGETSELCDLSIDFDSVTSVQWNDKVKIEGKTICRLQVFMLPRPKVIFYNGFCSLLFQCKSWFVFIHGFEGLKTGSCFNWPGGGGGAWVTCLRVKLIILVKHENIISRVTPMRWYCYVRLKIASPMITQTLSSRITC